MVKSTLSKNRLAIGIGVFCIVVFVTVRYTEVACNAIGGRWGIAEGVSTTSLCHYRGSCGKWLMPKVPCRSVTVGTSYARLHFLFGDPESAEDGQVRWKPAHCTLTTIERGQYPRAVTPQLQSSRSILRRLA